MRKIIEDTLLTLVVVGGVWSVASIVRSERDLRARLYRDAGRLYPITIVTGNQNRRVN